VCESTIFVEDQSYVTYLKSYPLVLVVPIKHTLHTSHYIKLHVLQRFITYVNDA
jgi:hypothetical protein